MSGEWAPVFGQLFDERFRSAAVGVNAYAPFRVMLGSAVGAFVGLGAGWTVAAIWVLAAVLGEVAMFIATRAVIRAEKPSNRWLWLCAGVYALTFLPWSAAGIILWSADSQACHLAATAFFAGHLLYLQSLHAHSPGAALPAVPPILLPAAVPLIFPHFQGADQVIVCLAMGAVVLNGLICMAVSLRKSRDLQETQVALVAASQAKSEFLARMSHEIRTPLNGVLGMTQALAAERDLKDGHRESLTVIRQSGESLLAILNDVLDLAKVEAGRMDLEEIVFDLEATVRGAQETFAPEAASKGLDFRLHIAPDAAGAYRGDPTRLRQILCNLLSNAVKFTEAGHVSLNIAAADGNLTIVVADTGIGIAAHHLPRLFGRFQQVDSSTTRRYGGSGLGLSICRELAQLMGGVIEVESLPGAGTHFTVTLPLARVSAFPGAFVSATEAIDLAAADEEAPIRILAAEDNPVNQLVLKTLLAQVGIEPDMVPDGAQALEAWRVGAYDLVLMDVQMPVLDGMAATRLIRDAEAAEGRPRTPILALTANAMQHQVADYIAGGFDGHVAKPIDAGRLYQAIAEAVRAGAPDRQAVA